MTTDRSTDLQAQVKALTELIEVAKAVVSTIDLDTLLRALLDHAMVFAEATAGSVALYDDHSHELEVHARKGWSELFSARRKWPVLRGSATEEAIRTRKVVCVPDLEASDYAVSSALRSEKVASLICIPLVLHERVLGVLYLASHKVRPMECRKVELLSVISTFAAMAVENAKLHRGAKLLAIIDPLTGLYNRRYFHQVMAQELERARRYNKALSIMMIDVDNFKIFNDRYGHSVGDRVLSAVGEIMLGSLRSIDSAFRYGGEEFMILLPETRLDSALQVADRLREQIEQQALDTLPEICDLVTVSVGVVTFPIHGRDENVLLDRADQLMYGAKASGKNRVHAPASPIY